MTPTEDRAALLAREVEPSYLALSDQPEAVANLDAELALLGIILYDAAALDLIGGHLAGEHFLEPFHGWLFDKAREIAGANRQVDTITLHELAQGFTAYQDLGGLAFLADLTDRAPPSTMAPEYARLIFDCALRRAMIGVCGEAINVLKRDRATPAFDFATMIRARLEEVERAAAPDEQTMIAADAASTSAVATMIRNKAQGRVLGLLTGLRCVDYRLGGLRPGKLIVIGGRPGMGKTALARAIADGAARRNRDHEFLFLGIEMQPEEMALRELSATSYIEKTWANPPIEYRAMQSTKALDDTSLMRLQLLAAEHVPKNLIFDDCPVLRLDDVRRKAWSIRRRGGKIGAIVIDYLQLMTKAEARGKNDADLLGEITMGLKQIARQFDCAVILLSQLSRALESRDDKRPDLGDLRSSGSIEQDADAVLFPYREVYYLERKEPKDPAKVEAWKTQVELIRHLMEVICAKNRGGPIGVDKQTYKPQFDYIEDWSE